MGLFRFDVATKRTGPSTIEMVTTNTISYSMTTTVLVPHTYTHTHNLIFLVSFSVFVFPTTTTHTHISIHTHKETADPALLLLTLLQSCVITKFWFRWFPANTTNHTESTEQQHQPTTTYYECPRQCSNGLLLCLLSSQFFQRRKGIQGRIDQRHIQHYNNHQRHTHHHHYHAPPSPQQQPQTAQKDY